VRARLLREQNRLRAMVQLDGNHPAWAFASLIFFERGSFTTLANFLDQPAAKAWLARCIKAGLVDKRPHSIFTNNSEFFATERALIIALHS
jgi:hypothetical protein